MDKGLDGSVIQDNRPFANTIRGQLEAEGLSVFLDTAAIEVHDPITPAVTDGIATCKIFLALYSPGYLESKACRQGLTLAYLTAHRDSSDAVTRRIDIYSTHVLSAFISVHQRFPASG